MASATDVGADVATRPQSTRLRQIAFITRDLGNVCHQLTHVLGSEVIYEDPEVAQFGLKNVLVPVGGDVLEIMSPVREGTTAGRLLDKRGEGGYMIIMQTEDAKKQRERIEERGGQVIWGYEKDEVVCVQYHPKSTKGGMMTELDSHTPSPSNLNPLTDRFSPWHACGEDYPTYSAGMKRTSHLSLLAAVLRLAPGDVRHEDAAKQWEDTYGISRTGSSLAFTNAQLKIIKGEEGQPEGLVSVTIGVNGKDRFDAMLDRVSKAGLCGDGWTNMLGIQWYFVMTGHEDGSKL